MPQLQNCLTTSLVSLCLSAALAADIHDVRFYGAKGDNRTLDTAAIQKAIDACAKAGGGQVYFPPGDYLSGTLALRSGVTLHLSPAATIWGSRKLGDYNPAHLIYARDARNIAIEGGGAINGNGEAFWDANFKPLPRPSPLIELLNCQDVRIQDVRILNAPAWTIRPKNCDRVKIRGITIVNHMRGLNTDGIDPDSSRNVIISDSYIEAGDDCIVLKTTDRGGPPTPCENVTVTNCVLISSASALKLGTESHGDFRHCVFSNCVIRKSRTGIALLAKDGGVMENISFSNITMETHPNSGQGVEWPIVIDLEKRTPGSKLSRVRDVSLSDIRIITKGRIMVTGMPASPLERLTFRNLVMRITGWEQIEGVKKLRGGTAKDHAETIDYGSAPAAFILAYARGVDLDGVRVVWDATPPAPERHAVLADHVDTLAIRGLGARQAADNGKLAAVALKNSRRVVVSGSPAEPGTSVFLGLEGTPESEVLQHGNKPGPARR